MASNSNPNHAPVAQLFFLVSASVASEVSARAAGVGPFRGLFFKATSSCTIVGFNGSSLALDAVQPNTTIWIQGSYISALVSVSTTAVYGLL